MTLKSLRAGFSTPPLGLQAPPRLYECWTLSDRLRCNCTTRNRYISLLHDSIQKGDPHPHLHAFHLHVSRRKATPTMGRPSWPDHAARRYSEPGSPPRRFGTHTSTPAQTSLSAARSIEIPDLGSRGAILYRPFLSAAVDHAVRWKTTGPLPNLCHPSHGDLRP